MIRTLRCLIPVAYCIVAYALVASSQEGGKYTIKTTTTAAPKEVSEGIRKLLSDTSVQLLDGNGKAICDVWFRKDIPVDATPEQIKNGITWREVKQTEIVAAVQFHEAWTDYRKQKIKAGVYTMRLAYQPTDGKHTADISEFQDFGLLVFAKDDTKPGLMDAKGLIDRSGDSLELAHPAVFMLWGNTKPGKTPEIASRPKGHWVVNSKSNIVVNGKATNAQIGIGLTLVGHSPAE
ncbi:MAG TPA: hypothetical protein VFE62_25015 [Gemmataceae bacterium]|nr:hypothetical protein [Gemmataceae bacterium]